MLKTLRKKGVAKKVLWFVAIIIIISFGFFGTASRLSDRKYNYAGKIFGKKISFNTFQVAYQNVGIHALIQYGDNYKKFFDVESQTWDQLILLHEANKRKIKISNEQVIAEIAKYPFFQTDNKFDPEAYERIVKYAFRVRSRDFEESVRDKLKFAALYEDETKNVTVSDEEVFNDFKKQNEKVQISYIFIDPNNYKKEAKVTDEEIKKYYDDNKSEFMKSPTVNVDYISLDFPEMKPIEKKEGISDEEYQKEKDAVEAEFQTEKEKTIDKASGIYYDLLNNPDAQAVAKQAQVEIKNTGFFSMEQPNLSLGGSYPLLNKIFELKKDEITEPFETNNGVIIAKLKDKKDAYIPEFEEAKDAVKESVLKKKSFEIANYKTKEYLTKLSDELDKSKLKDFPKAAKNLGLDINQTPAFTRGQYLPKIGISKEFQESAFSLTDENPISNIIETQTGFCILHLDNYTPADKNEFDKQKDELSKTALQMKKNETFKEFLTRLRLMAQLEDHLPKEENTE